MRRSRRQSKAPRHSGIQASTTKPHRAAKPTSCFSVCVSRLALFSSKPPPTSIPRVSSSPFSIHPHLHTLFCPEDEPEARPRSKSVRAWIFLPLSTSAFATLPQKTGAPFARMPPMFSSEMLTRLSFSRILFVKNLKYVSRPPAIPRQLLIPPSPILA